VWTYRSRDGPDTLITSAETSAVLLLPIFPPLNSIMPCPPFLNLNEVEALAKDILPQPVYDYFRGGSNDEITLRENTACYSRMKLMPRMLRNVSQISTSRSIPGLGKPSCADTVLFLNYKHSQMIVNVQVSTCPFQL
jgi:hypothetical protein